MWLVKILPNNAVCHLGIDLLQRHQRLYHEPVWAGDGGRAAAAVQAGEADRAVAVGHDTPFEAKPCFTIIASA
jgi:hypothetical protein